MAPVPTTTVLGYQLAFSITCLLITTFILVTTYMFWTRRHLESIRKRMVPLVLFTALCGAITGNMSLATMDDMIAPIYQVCLSKVVVQTIFGSLWIYGNFLRALNLLYMNVVNQIRYELSIDPQSTFVKSLPYWKVLVLKVFSTRKAVKKDGNTSNKRSTTIFSSTAWGHSRNGGGNSKAQSGAFSSDQEKVVSSRPEPTGETENSDSLMVLDMTGEIPLRSLMYWILGMLLVCILGVFFEIFVTAPAFHANIFSSEACPRPMLYARYVLQTLILILTPIVLYSIRDVEDSMNLRNEIYATSLVNMTIYLYYFLIIFAPQLEVIKGEVGGGLMGVIGVSMQHCVTVIWPLYESYTIQKKMKRLRESQLEGGQMTIECMVAVLENPVSFLDFKKELLMQFCIENGIFFDEYRKAERKINAKTKKDTALIEKELRRFDNMFVASGSQQELNIPYKIKKVFQELVKEGSTDFDILLPIKDEVLKMMFLNTYPRYLKTQSQDGKK